MFVPNIVTFNLAFKHNLHLVTFFSLSLFVLFFLNLLVKLFIYLFLLRHLPLTTGLVLVYYFARFHLQHNA